MAGVMSRLSAAARPSTHLSAAARPPVHLSAAANSSTRLSAAARPSTLLSAAARPATLRPSATVLPVRRLHSQVPSTPPELPSWVKDEVRKLVREVVAEETRGMKEVCFERFDDICSRLITISKDAAKLHAETMVMHVDTKELLKIALRICISMGGLAVATPLLRAGPSGDEGSPPSREEVVDIVRQEAITTMEEIHKTLKLELEVMAANHFLSEEKRQESKKNQP